jgi:ATP-binding cassette, subfamily B, bacterial
MPDDITLPPSQEPLNEEGCPLPDRTRAYYLTPDLCEIYQGIHQALYVTVKDQQTYGGVYAAYVFPVEYEDRYISLLKSTGEGDDIEIGIIRDLKDFPEEQAALVRQALARRYFIHLITQIHSIRWEHGLIAMEVETDKGRVSFLMRSKTDRAVEYGRRGKVLIDVDENRYVIPDIETLPPDDRAAFTRIIYW